MSKTLAAECELWALLLQLHDNFDVSEMTFTCVAGQHQAHGTPHTRRKQQRHPDFRHRE